MFEKQVFFLGEIDNKSVFGELAKSRFFVLPSFPEGFGIVYLEAMASECITIGTEGEGISELIVSGENGYLVNRNSPNEIARLIEECIKNPSEAEHLAQKGKKSVSKLGWKENSQRYIKLYEKLLLRE